MKLRDKDGLTEQEFLAAYSPGDYVCPSVAADMVIFTVTDAEKQNYRKLPDKELRVLLIERGGHPFLGSWALPGGFVGPNETVWQAAVRELQEETGASGIYLEQLHLFSDPDRDPRSWVMSCAFMALADSRKLHIEAGDDADNASWFRVGYPCSSSPNFGRAYALRPEQPLCLTLEQDNITLSALLKDQPENGAHYPDSLKLMENNGLAFDHAKIISYALEQLRQRIESTDLAFHLMPPFFTLTQLQQVYEVILGKPLLKAAFRRKMEEWVEDSGRMTDGAGHRPSKLYRKKNLYQKKEDPNVLRY